MRGHQRSDGLLQDYCDGSGFKTHSLFSTDPTALQVMLFYDDVEICNPIGSRSKIHKLGNENLDLVMDSYVPVWLY